MDLRRADRIPVAPLKTLISTLATRTNYGLSLSSLPSDYVLPKDGEGAEPSEVPLPLQYWVWEVEDEEMWVQEMKGKWEKRKAERVEVSFACLRSSVVWSRLRCTKTSRRA